MKFLLKLIFYPIIGIIVLFVLIGIFADSPNETKKITSVQNCENVAPYYLDAQVILNSASRSLGVKVLDAKAVRSNDYKRFYFVQYKMSTPQNGIVYPMFAMNKPTVSGGGNGVIFSMDDLAVTLTSFGDARKLKNPFSSGDDGFSRASSCLK